MNRLARTPNRYGTEKRARIRTEVARPPISERITTPMTTEERAWMEVLPKTKAIQRIIGANLWMSKDQGIADYPSHKVTNYGVNVKRHEANGSFPWRYSISIRRKHEISSGLPQ